MSKKKYKQNLDNLKVRAIPTKKTEDGKQLYRIEAVHKEFFV